MSTLQNRISKLECAAPAKQANDLSGGLGAFIERVRDLACGHPDISNVATPEATALMAWWKTERCRVAVEVIE